MATGSESDEETLITTLHVAMTSRTVGPLDVVTSFAAMQ